MDKKLMKKHKNNFKNWIINKSKLTSIRLKTAKIKMNNRKVKKEIQMNLVKDLNKLNKIIKMMIS